MIPHDPSPPLFLSIFHGVEGAKCTLPPPFETPLRTPVQYLLQNHLPSHEFLPIITRDTPNVLPKPDPAGILHIAQEWGLTNRAENMIMVSACGNVMRQEKRKKLN